ncbi:MAG TPA: DUF2780 domain-containing protein [Kiritimatiellia bacterium]|nr:DUF2780 domain-containing protein [Kiritimatiellia bacterium]
MQELIQQLTSQLKISEAQAQGGAGLLFKMAQSKLGGDFSQVSAALPEVGDLISKAPEAGGASKLLGGLASSLGGKGAADLATLAAGFSKLNLNPAMVKQFAPIVLSFLQTKISPEVLGKLAGMLKG